MAHDHSHHHHAPATGSARGALTVALVLNAGFTVVQAIVGIAIGSVALIADAGHNLSDVAGLAIALFAAVLMTRPATPRHSFGYRRAEVLAALANALTVVFVAGFVALEAVRRLGDPPDVPGMPVVLTAAAGIAVNAGSAWLIHRTGRTGHDLNVRAAILHLAADTAASLGVVVAGLTMIWWGWELADPIAAIGVSLLVLVGSWGILARSLSVLLEAAPPGVDPEELGHAVASIDGVVQVHDLHVWSVSSDFPALSAHVVVETDADCHALRRVVSERLVTAFGITHATLQMEHAPRRHLMPGAPVLGGCHDHPCGDAPVSGPGAGSSSDAASS